MRIEDIRYVPARLEDRERGLMGFVSLSLGSDLRLDGLCVRRTRERGFALSFPSRRDASGAEHSIVRPLSARARAEIEGVVLGEVRKRGFIT